MRLRSRLLACKHQNTNAYDYVRNDSILDDMLAHDDFNQRQEISNHLTGMRFCLDCGATQRFKLRDPLAILDTTEKEPWLAPWLWRKL